MLLTGFGPSGRLHELEALREKPNAHPILQHLRCHAAEAELHEARRTLAALRVSERSERHWLQTVCTELWGLAGKHSHPTPRQVELQLELETHQANIATIQQHIGDLRRRIEAAQNHADEPGQAVMRMIEARAAARTASHH